MPSRTKAVCALASLVACAQPAAKPVPMPLPTSAPSAAAKYAMAPVELVSFQSGSLTLHGFLWRPASGGRFPAVVFNHGSEEYPGAKGDEAQFYVTHGFVLFVPHRRGHGRSHDAGDWIGGVVSQFPAVVSALERQSDDVIAAVDYVASLPYVDAKRVAVAGCSFGGIETLLAAERGHGIVAAVDFAGGAMAWAHNEPLRARMKTAAANVQVPILFIQAENDFDTSPTKELSVIAQRAGKRARARIFPSNGTTEREGHAFCKGGESPAWGEEVLGFLRGER